MIRQIHIANYKSIDQLDVELGRINVIIGENGSGKSNFLEAIAFAAAAGLRKLDHEFLAARGIRVTEPRFMRSAFADATSGQPILATIRDGEDGAVDDSYILQCTEGPGRTEWREIGHVELEFDEKQMERLMRAVQVTIESLPEQQPEKIEYQALLSMLRATASGGRDIWKQFLVYSPENSALRIFQSEGQVLPLGVKGEGLFAYLKALNESGSKERLREIIEKLALLDWFDRLDIPADLAPGEHRIRIRDRYLVEGALFDQRSASEGFLFLLFYFTVFASPETPSFFAIDNVDASLNPKLCSAVMRELVDLADRYDKQAILTTHNPAVLDGLDLADDEQRLFVVYRNADGATRIRRVPAPVPVAGQPPIKLSEAFMRGYIGGLPKNF